MTFKYTCPTCDLEIEYEYMPPTPDVPYLRNGDPGHPGTDAEVDGPEFCPSCETEIDLDAVITKGADAAADQADDYPEED